MTDEDAALIVIDVQVDFCPGGRLAVAGGDEVVPGIDAAMEDFGAVVLTQDWHPADHASFAANHPGAADHASIQMAYGPQVLWPVHCVQGSEGAAFHPGLRLDRADLILRKGFRAAVDSYSAFFENDRTTATGLGGYLRDRGVRRVVLAGLAYDFCVGWSALDAAALGFEVEVRRALCRAIDIDGSCAAREAEMRAAGVVLA